MDRDDRAATRPARLPSGDPDREDRVRIELKTSLSPPNSECYAWIRRPDPATGDLVTDKSSEITVVDDTGLRRAIGADDPECTTGVGAFGKGYFHLVFRL